MERRITEEKVTKTTLNWLEETGWEIICFDFPQSGTGVSLHLNAELRTTKNKGSIIPDIVAIKSETVVFFENKDRFLISDFLKVSALKNTFDYSGSIKKLLKGFTYSKIYYGIAIAHTIINELKTNEHLDKIDFAVFVNKDHEISLIDKMNIFS